MKRVLIIAHMGQMIAQFNHRNIDILLNMDVEVHIAANFTSPLNTMSEVALHDFTNVMKKKGCPRSSNRFLKRGRVDFI